MAVSSIRSKKSKGMGFQKDVRLLLLLNFTLLLPDDIKVAVASLSGEDIKMSPAARRKIPYSFLCKRCESLNIYKAILQAKANSKTYTPAVVFRKNHMES